MKRLVCLELTIQKICIKKFTFKAKCHESLKFQTTKIWNYVIYAHPLVLVTDVFKDYNCRLQGLMTAEHCHVLCCQVNDISIMS